jgi:hypothetical protein
VRVPLVCCCLALAAPALAAAPRNEPVVVLSATSLLQLEAEREDLRAHLARADKLTGDALRKVKSAAVEDAIVAARNELDDAREYLGLQRKRKATVVVPSRDEDPRFASAAVSETIVVADVNAILQALDAADLHLVEAEQRAGKTIDKMLADARAEIRSARALLAGLTAAGARVPVTDKVLQGILADLKKEEWARDRLGVLESAANDRYFLVSQVLKILARFEFPRHQLEAVEILNGHIIDRHNTKKRAAVFKTASDKERLERILQAPVMVTYTPARAETVAPSIDDAALQQLLARLRAAGPRDARFRLLQEEATRSHFRIAQLKQIVGVFATNDAKMRAVVILRERVTDPEAYEQLFPLFPNPHDHLRLRNVLGQ